MATWSGVSHNGNCLLYTSIGHQPTFGAEVGEVAQCFHRFQGDDEVAFSCGNEVRSDGSVSYTHLDVYKRQIRAIVDERNEKIGRKIRDNEMKRIPYMLVVGEKEGC